MKVLKVSGLDDGKGNIFTAYFNLDKLINIYIKGDVIEITTDNMTYKLKNVDVERSSLIIDKLLGVNSENHLVKYKDEK